MGGPFPDGGGRHVHPWAAAERGRAEAVASPSLPASLSALETHPQRLQAIQVLRSIPPPPPPPRGVGRN